MEIEWHYDGGMRVKNGWPALKVEDRESWGNIIEASRYGKVAFKQFGQ